MGDRPRPARASGRAGIPVPLRRPEKPSRSSPVLVQSATELDHQGPYDGKGVAGRGRRSKVRSHVSQIYGWSDKALGPDRSHAEDGLRSRLSTLGRLDPSAAGRDRPAGHIHPSPAHPGGAAGEKQIFNPLIKRLIGRTAAAQVFVRDHRLCLSVVTLTGPLRHREDLGSRQHPKPSVTSFPTLKTGGGSVELASLSDPGLVPSTVDRHARS